MSQRGKLPSVRQREALQGMVDHGTIRVDLSGVGVSGYIHWGPPGHPESMEIRPRTVNSLLVHGWAEWESREYPTGKIRITEAGREALTQQGGTDYEQQHGRA